MDVIIFALSLMLAYVVFKSLLSFQNSGKKLPPVNKLDANQHLRSRKVNELIEYVKKCSQTGESVDIGRAAFTTSLNLLSNTIFSKDISADPNEDSAKEFRDLIRDIMVDAGQPNLVDFFPVMKKLDPQGVKRIMTRHYDNLVKVLDGLINERFSLMRSTNPVKYTDALNELIKISRENPDEIDKIHMEHLFVDLFVAGTDTT
ncbi:Geraniol 8-hydroxylase [Heracleum sosnowskyi]|uniref:Geraniol 8-hydroxylase n=1 Tax=Heracleum sosnowskyi TaxID=360622 RepID=A0AAD8IF55_9APIA|nr:Geraniol 8-hydroxylase [Heracleum sosnowskyi]